MHRCLAAGVLTGVGLVLLLSVAQAQEQNRRAPASHSPAQPLRRVVRGEPLDPCPPLGGERAVTRESRGNGFTVDSCGRKVSAAGEFLPFTGKTAVAHVTIDRMTISQPFASHGVGEPLTLLGSAGVYTLSDGGNWSSGAGSYSIFPSALDHVEVSGTTLRYVLTPPADGLLYQQTDYDSGDHSAQGTLGASGPLVLEAQAGSPTAVMHGAALLVANDDTGYGEPRFNYYSAVVGSVVPFELVLTMQGGTWSADAFNRSFNYTVTGSVDFAHPVSTPLAVALTIGGSAQVPDEVPTRFTATVHYENGALRDVSSAAVWSVDPVALASIAGGVLTPVTLQTPQAELTLHASYGEGTASLAAQKQVLCVADLSAETPGAWPMFQANARHTGYLPTSIEPTALRFRWRKNLGNGQPLNPVAAGDGKVFATLLTYFSPVTSLFALRGADGATLWSAGFEDVFSVNPPSYAYGNVYVQTGNHASDTWLHAFDGETGAPIFKAPHAAQWERYFAPTMYDGKAYVNGGYYGGMYSFDAFSGSQLWFIDLPQYDEWTPAVDSGRAYAYVGDYAPGLYARDRPTGTSALFVADPNFDWNGWSMDMAPVIGDHGDVLAIHDGRLLSFDTALGTIRWEVQSQFTGQPSLAHDRIYAIDGGRLRVLDELTHAEIWSWQAADGDLAGPMIVTERHVFVSTEHSVHAVDLAAHQSVWSYPEGGHLALGGDTLYVATSDGALTALSIIPTASFFTVTPCRVIDTRGTGGAPIGGPALFGGTPRTLQIGGLCGVLATATAVSVNVTVTGAGAPGALHLDATGLAASPVSAISYPFGKTRANNVIVGLDAAGNLVALADQPTGTAVHLLMDVNGYFE